MTSTTTPAPCVCDEMPDEIKIPFISSMLTQELLYKLVPLDHGEEITFSINDDVGWIIDGKPVDLGGFDGLLGPNPNAPPSKIALPNQAIPLIFRKVEDQLGELQLYNGCPVYLSENNTAVGLKVEVTVPNDGFVIKTIKNIIIEWIVVLYLDDNDAWTMDPRILYHTSGDYLAHKLLKQDSSFTCPGQWHFLETNDARSDLLFRYVKKEKNKDDLDFSSKLLRPFKNSVLGYI